MSYAPIIASSLNPATPKQVAFIAALAKERDIPQEWAAQITLDLEAGTTRYRASKWIEWLKEQPLLTAPASTSWVDAEIEKQKSLQKLTTGLYSASGRLYRVRERKRAGMRLGILLDRVEVVDGKKPILHPVRPERSDVRDVMEHGVRLSVEEAGALGLRTGWCLLCGRELTDPESVKNGIGPTCAKKQGVIG